MNGMRRTLLYIISVLAVAAAVSARPVRTGIEVLRDSGFAALRGKRVGLVTNPTGVDRNLRSTVDILHEVPEVELVALFAPEHGVRGDVYAGAAVDAARDSATGLPVYSLYGKTRRPTAGMLAGIDAVVYDIQDNGCRSFTFISTMGQVMEACAAAGKEFVVLDRPNPVGGDKVEGPLTEDDCISFVSQYPIPYLYGLTCGELARYLNAEVLAEPVRLTVVPMEGWRRSMTYAETGLPWVLPSPHVPTAETALYYPASGILGELECMSIGVGYTMPFRLFCAQWADGRRLADELNALSLPGVAFRPVSVKPFYGFGKGTLLNGVELFITDPHVAELTLIQFYVMEAVARLWPEHAPLHGATAARLSMFDKVCGSKEVRRRFARRHSVSDIADLWRRDADGFRSRSSRYFLYDY